MPFFPRVLVHFIRLRGRIRQRAWLQGCLGQRLQTVPPAEQLGPLATQFPGQLRRRGSLGDAAEEQQHVQGAFLRSVQHRPGIGVEDPAAAPTAIIQDRVTIPAVHAVVLALPTARTAQTLRVEQVN